VDILQEKLLENNELDNFTKKLQDTRNISIAWTEWGKI